MADIQTQLPVKLTNNTNTAAITSGNALQVDLGATTANATPIVVTGSGTAGTAASGVITIQGIASMTPVSVSGTVTANAGTGNFNVVGTLTHNNAAPAANNVGVLPAVASTAAPTYTTGDQVLLSTDLSGNLRVNISGSSGTGNVNLTQVGGSAIALGQTTMSASLPVVIASNQSNLVVVGNLTNNNAAPTTTNIGALVAAANTTPPTYTNTDQVLLQTDLNGNLKIVAGQNAATSGTITTSASTVTVATVGYNAVTVSVNGTYTGVNFTFEASDDGGTTYYTVAAARLDNTAVNTSTGVIASQTAIWTAYLGATTNFRVRATAYATGTANIHLTPTVIGVSPAVIATVSSGSTNITQIAGNAVTTAAAGMQKVGIADSNGASIVLGQTTMSASLPVTIASNQSNLAVVGTLTTNSAAPTSNNIGVLPAVASTAAPTYTTGDQVLLSTDLSGNLRVTLAAATSSVNLTEVGGAAIALGQTTMSASLPVAIASNQSTLIVAGTLTNNNAAPTTTNFGVLPALANTTAPTYTNGDQVLLSTDLSANLRVAGSGTAGTPAGGVLSVQGVAGGTVLPISGTVTANAGTGTFTVAGNLTNNNAAPAATNIGALVALCNTAAPTFTNGDQTLLSVDTAGNLRVSVTATGGTSTVVGNLTNNNAAPGATNLGVLPALANTAAPSYTNGDQVLLSTDLAANLRVAGSGTAGTPAGGVLSVQGVAGGTAQPISGTVTANAGTGNFTVVGTLTNNNAAPTTTNVGALVAVANSTPPTYSAGDQVLLQTDLNGNTKIVAGQNAATAGTITTSASTVAVAMPGYNGVVVSVNGTYAGVNFTFEASDDGGTTYYTVAAARSDNTAVQTSTGVITANSSIMWDVYTGAVTNFRVRATAYTSGTANIHLTPTVIGQDPATISNITGSITVAGNLTHNNAAPTANNVGVLPAVASTAAPTYTNTDQVLLSTDLSGNLRVTLAAATSSVNLTQVGGSAIALGQTTMSASLPVTIASNQSNLVVVGNLTHNNAAPTTTNLGALVAVASTAAPTYTTGDQVLLSTDLAGNTRVAGSGTAGTPAGGVLSVQGVAGGTVLPISGTVTANAGTGNFNVVGTLTNNNAAPTSNNVGALVALCNTAAPTFTNGDQTLLSVDTAGNLRVSVTATGGTSTVVGNLTNNNAAPGATNLGVLPAIASTAAQSYTTGDQVLLSTDLAGNLRTFNTGPSTGIVTSYTDTSAVASGSTGTATYTTSGTGTFHLTQIIASSSGGPCRVQVDYGAGPTIIFVGFYASSSPFLTVNFATPVLIAASTAVNVKIQNNAGASQDVYATIVGYQTT